MSTSFTPGKDLLLHAKMPARESIFTTFAASHFVRPGQFTQPVKTVDHHRVFTGCFTQVFVAAPLELDFDEPHAVVDSELELVEASGCTHQMQVIVAGPPVSNESKGLDRVIQTRSSRSAA